MKKNFLFTALMFLMLVVLTACADEGGEGGVATNNDDGGDGEGGSITVYSPETPEFTQELANKFEELHGINVNVHYAGTNVLVNQMMAEQGNPQADVWYGGGGILPFEAAVEQGLLEQYTPEAAEDWEVVQDGIKYKHEDGYYTGVELFVLGFAYNPDNFSEDEVPNSWDELLDPEWENGLQFPNPAASGTATLMVMDQMMRQGEDSAWEYFDTLVEHANSIPDSGSSPTSAVSLGETDIGIGFDFMAYEQQSNGESVDFIIPDLTPVIANPAALVADSPNPDGGKLFIDFMLSDEAQQIIADWQHLPISENVESQTPLDLETAKEHAVELDIDWVNENYDRVRDEWRNRYQ
ncbi:ABC transporter substrate-binding protein [Corticicoccus populi]|uniref:ABC transporter substrate-binding protein n=1 Tax=Corticicoccus populi TaxID=1812821 RepID=A0ABW5WYP2_9STAP